MDKKKKRQGGINRREFMKTGAMAMGAAMTSGLVLPDLEKRAEAAKRDYILIGRPNPTTGPLASFGEGTPWVDERVLYSFHMKPPACRLVLTFIPLSSQVRDR